MRSLTDHLANYAAYHRNRRNIITHFIGIPMIVLGITILLSRPLLNIGGLLFTPAHVAVLVALVFYYVLDSGFGVLMTLVLGVALALAQMTTGLTSGEWLATGIGLFIVGWIFQFVGHYFEGRKPAFVDDIIGLLIGPLFLVAEVVFAVGLRKNLHREVQEKSKTI